VESADGATAIKHDIEETHEYSVPHVQSVHTTLLLYRNSSIIDHL